jgi:hypothetical protein
MNEMMLQATRLTRAYHLTEATALLQRMLRGETAPDTTIGPTDDPTGSKPPIIDVKAETIGETVRLLLNAASAQPYDFRTLRDLTYRAKRRSARPVSTPDILPQGGKFIEAIYANAAGSRAYKLYIPSRYRGQALPLVIMLHGGTQTPDDFAAGTRMNVIAEEHTCLVVYPAQPSHANPTKCWNWFRATDQRRGHGEPSLVAGMVLRPCRKSKPA